MVGADHEDDVGYLAYSFIRIMYLVVVEERLFCAYPLPLIFYNFPEKSHIVHINKK